MAAHFLLRIPVNVTMYNGYKNGEKYIEIKYDVNTVSCE